VEKKISIYTVASTYNLYHNTKPCAERLIESKHHPDDMLLEMNAAFERHPLFRRDEMPPERKTNQASNSWGSELLCQSNTPFKLSTAETVAADGDGMTGISHWLSINLSLVDIQACGGFNVSTLP
jgi:hypothetical protein